MSEEKRWFIHKIVTIYPAPQQNAQQTNKLDFAVSLLGETVDKEGPFSTGEECAQRVIELQNANPNERYICYRHDDW